MRRVKNCASICARFNVPLCHVQDKGVILYLQMTLYEGTLAQWMRQQVNETDVWTIIKIVRQIISGVDYIHSVKVTHHDVKV